MPLFVPPAYVFVFPAPVVTTGGGASDLVSFPASAVQPDTNYQVILTRAVAVAGSNGQIAVINKTTVGFEIQDQTVGGGTWEVAIAREQRI